MFPAASVFVFLSISGCIKPTRGYFYKSSSKFCLVLLAHPHQTAILVRTSHFNRLNIPADWTQSTWSYFCWPILLGSTLLSHWTWIHSIQLLGINSFCLHLSDHMAWSHVRAAWLGPKSSASLNLLT